jgi:hypothetical protein
MAFTLTNAQIETATGLSFTDRTEKTVTKTEWALLGNAVFGRWENVGEAAGVSGVTDTFDQYTDRITSMVELSRRNTTTNVRTRYRMSTHYDSTTGYLYKEDMTGNTLVLSGTTQLSNTLLKTGKPVWAIYQNRAFMVSGALTTADKIWTDGTNVYQIGITAPTVDPVEDTQSNSGGYLSDGAYNVKYTYYRSTDYGAESNPSDPVTITMAEGGSTQSCTVTVKYSADPQVDRIKVYRTTIGVDSSSAFYYYESYIANVVGTGTGTVTIGTTTDTALATAGLIDTDNDRPPDSHSICAIADRMFYANTQYVYYSELGLPEKVPTANRRQFDPDDGEDIQNIRAFRSYVLVQKKSKTWLLDANEPATMKPILLTAEIGCLAYRAYSPCASGQLGIWLSQEGLYKTDGHSVESICSGKNYKDIMTHMDKSSIANCKSIYYPNDAQYIIYMPYLNSQYRLWVYSIYGDNFVQWEYPFIPNAVALWTDENSLKRFIIATYVKGVELGRRSWFGHFVMADYNHYKDVSESSIYGDSDTQYSDITQTVTTQWNNVGTPELKKDFSDVYLEWYSSGVATANLTLGLDHGRDSSTAALAQSAESFPSGEPTGWGSLGYEFISGWDFKRNEIDNANWNGTPMGERFSLKFSESSSEYTKVYSFTLNVSDPTGLDKSVE